MNLSKRLAHYFSQKHIETHLKTGKSAIYSSRIKNGISNFILEILIYCSPEKCIKLEQKYINLLKPEYNILQIAGSLLGFKLRTKVGVLFKKNKYFIFLFFKKSDERSKIGGR